MKTDRDVLTWPIPGPGVRTSNPKHGRVCAWIAYVSLLTTCLAIVGIVRTPSGEAWSVVCIFAGFLFFLSALAWAGIRNDINHSGAAVLAPDGVTWSYGRRSSHGERQYQFPCQQFSGFAVGPATGDYAHIGWSEVTFHLREGWQTQPLVIDPGVSPEQVRRFCRERMHLPDVTDVNVETASAVYDISVKWLGQNLARNKGLLCGAFRVEPEKRDDGAWLLWRVPKLGEVIFRPSTEECFLEDGSGKTPRVTNGEDLARRIAARSAHISPDTLATHLLKQVDRGEYKSALPRRAPIERYCQLFAELLAPYIVDLPTLRSVEFQHAHDSRSWLFAEFDDGADGWHCHLDATWSPLRGTFTRVHFWAVLNETSAKYEARVVATAREAGFYTECDMDYATWVF